MKNKIKIFKFQIILKFKIFTFKIYNHHKFNMKIMNKSKHKLMIVRKVTIIIIIYYKKRENNQKLVKVQIKEKFNLIRR